MYGAYVPFLHTPVPEKRNPVLFLPTNRVLRVSIVEEGGEGPGPGNHAVMMYRAFREFLKKEFGELPNVRPVILAHPGLMIWEYLAMTTALIEYLVGKVDKEVLEAVQVIDRHLGLGEEVIGMRLSPVMRGPYVWRDGEGAIEMNRMIGVTVRPVRNYSMRYMDPGSFSSGITHIAGYLTIEAAKTITGEGGGLDHLARIHRGLWHALYGIPVSDGDIILVRDMGRAVAMEFSLGAVT